MDGSGGVEYPVTIGMVNGIFLSVLAVQSKKNVCSEYLRIPSAQYS